MRRLALFSAVLWLGACAVLTGEEKKEPAKIEPTEEEKAVVEFTNRARAKEKLPPLKLNPVLLQVARAHTENMAKTGKVEHDLDGKTSADRVKEAGYRARVVGENISKGEGRFPPEAVVMGWMMSKGHRENIVSDEFTEIGVGIAKVGKVTYYTQVFATPR